MCSSSDVYTCLKRHTAAQWFARLSHCEKVPVLSEWSLRVLPVSVWVNLEDKMFLTKSNNTDNTWLSPQTSVEDGVNIFSSKESVLYTQRNEYGL